MIRVRFRLDLAPGSSVGPGKIDLLAAIDAEGSLSAAARQIGMSYRRAWLLLDNLNHAFDSAVTMASVGGRGGGGVALTPFGRELVRHYRAFDAEVTALAVRRWNRLMRSSRPQGRSSGPERRPLKPERATAASRRRSGRRSVKS